MDDRPYGRNKAPFSNSSSVVLTRLTSTGDVSDSISYSNSLLQNSFSVTKHEKLANFQPVKMCTRTFIF